MLHKELRPYGTIVFFLVLVAWGVGVRMLDFGERVIVPSFFFFAGLARVWNF